METLIVKGIDYSRRRGYIPSEEYIERLAQIEETRQEMIAARAIREQITLQYKQTISYYKTKVEGLYEISLNFADTFIMDTAIMIKSVMKMYGKRFSDMIHMLREYIGLFPMYRKTQGGIIIVHPYAVRDAYSMMIEDNRQRTIELVTI